ncbi:MAG: M56 family metallopeptidase, partial [Chloracidobacterium sp.]|nr:M56 family metallopeptidase [Chloracidobacterium sp.]
MTFHQSLAEWSRWFWPGFANHLWQASLLASVVWIAAFWLRRARTRHLIWLMALMKFLLPPAFLFLLARDAGLNFRWPGRTEMIAGGNADVLLLIAEPVEQGPQSNAGAGHHEVYCVLTTLWLIGIALLLAHWGWRRRRFARVALTGEKVEAGRIASTLGDLKSRLDVSRRVELIISSSFAEPVVWRALRPLIVMPQGLAERLSDGELESVLAHELFHIKRFDNLFGALQMFVCCLFWFHPLVWLIDRRLIEEREVMCDERVILHGAAPEAYAASLWKVVQFGFGWPAGGVSRATGSNLKRRVKLMLNASHRSKSSAASRALAGMTFVVLITLAVAMALFSRDGLAGEKAQNDQDQNFLATAPVQFENLPDIPVVITEARLSAGDARVMTNGFDPDSPHAMDSHLAVRGGTARDVEFVASLVNQSDRRVTAVSIQILNTSLWANEPLNTISNPISGSGAPASVAGPQESFTFKAKFPLPENKDDLDLMDHLYEFKIRVTGVKFESEEDWLMALPGKTPSTYRARIGFNSAEDVASQVKMRKKDNSNNYDQSPDDSVQPMTASLPPTITYKEKAQYTQEAKDNNIEGTVVLNVVFCADGHLGDIKVIKELPYGLTENTIVAAKKIRFIPAVKHGHPVSVRGNLEFTFKLHDDPIQQMNASTRPT